MRRRPDYPAGWAEDSLCDGCRNLIAQRDEVYPAAFRELLNRIGIGPAKECESVDDGPLENGLHRYGGWFFFIGEMVTAGERLVEVSDEPYFRYFFTPGGPCPKGFPAGPALAIEFIAHLKWVL